MSRQARKHEHRLRRQFDAIVRGTSMPRGPVDWLIHDRKRLIRVPVAILLIIGGIFSFLPVLGAWMIPVGLMLLALDVPMLRPRVNAAVIRGRRRISLWRRRFFPDKSNPNKLN
ncbi:hypothetical protein CNY89_06545 [Amaricoccus sp. HAR-UPW-R2A-40]|nr:hypothetical protein CNY89_06545 [Amaricoccus sp. HAR-UPW-R2A-40]